MKKAIAAVLVVAVCGVVSWGYLALKAAFLNPAPLEERRMGPYPVGFGPEEKASESRRAGRTSGVESSLTAAGIGPGAAFCLLVAGSAGCGLLLYLLVERPLLRAFKARSTSSGTPWPGLLRSHFLRLRVAERFKTASAP